MTQGGPPSEPQTGCWPDAIGRGNPESKLREDIPDPGSESFSYCVVVETSEPLAKEDPKLLGITAVVEVNAAQASIATELPTAERAVVKSFEKNGLS